MSREILFRGKTEKGKWIEGFYTMLDEDGDGQWIEHYILTGNSDKFYGSGTCRETFEKAEVLPGTVGQFTGLLDKNGTRRYVDTGHTVDDYDKLEAENQKLRDANRWIPVSDRLPAQKAYYYCEVIDSTSVSRWYGAHFKKNCLE